MRYFSSARDWQKLSGSLAGSESTWRFCLAAPVHRWRVLCERMFHIHWYLSMPSLYESAPFLLSKKERRTVPLGVSPHA